MGLHLDKRYAVGHKPGFVEIAVTLNHFYSFAGIIF